MTTLYHYIAGQSLERLAALSDGIFAVAMKLLVLDLRLPERETLHLQQPLWAIGAVQSEQVLWDGLVELAPRQLLLGGSDGQPLAGSSKHSSQALRQLLTLTETHHPEKVPRVMDLATLPTRP